MKLSVAVWQAYWVTCATVEAKRCQVQYGGWAWPLWPQLWFGSTNSVKKVIVNLGGAVALLQHRSDTCDTPLENLHVLNVLIVIPASPANASGPAMKIFNSLQERASDKVICVGRAGHAVLRWLGPITKSFGDMGVVWCYLWAPSLHDPTSNMHAKHRLRTCDPGNSLRLPAVVFEAVKSEQIYPNFSRPGASHFDEDVHPSPSSLALLLQSSLHLLVLL